MNAESIKRCLTETARLQLCRDSGILIEGRTFRPDKDTAFVECYLSHSFPVVTIDDTALHPRVIANSYQSMRYKVFDLAHLMKKYDPKNNPRDRILGTIVAVEFPPEPAGGWEVQADKSRAPCIRALACMHKNAEGVDKILSTYFNGEMKWTVSMEQEFFVMQSGFLIAEPYDESGEHEAKESEQWEEWEEETPVDLRKLGWVYVPAVEAPDSLMACLHKEEAKIIRAWSGRKVVLLIGGLSGTISYKGIGLTPSGKEKEAEVSQMLASQKVAEVNGELVPDVVGLLERTARLPD